MADNSPKNEFRKRANKEDMASLLECPYCFEIPLPPVYQCKTGHMICNNCRKNVIKCGICEAEMTDTRNFFYESLFEKTTFVCKYAQEGCPQVMFGNKLKNHENICDFGYGNYCCFDSEF